MTMIMITREHQVSKFVMSEPWRDAWDGGPLQTLELRGGRGIQGRWVRVQISLWNFSLYHFHSHWNNLHICEKRRRRETATKTKAAPPTKGEGGTQQWSLVWTTEDRFGSVDVVVPPPPFSGGAFLPLPFRVVLLFPVVLSLSPFGWRSGALSPSFSPTYWGSCCLLPSSASPSPPT